LGLIMITHLGPGIDRSKDKPTSDRQGEGSQAKAGAALVNHITQYHNKGFLIKRVTSDGEGSIKASRPQVESPGADLNILGHGSHTPHAKSAIRHIKNKARSTLHSLPYVLPQNCVQHSLALLSTQLTWCQKSTPLDTFQHTLRSLDAFPTSDVKHFTPLASQAFSNAPAIHSITLHRHAGTFASGWAQPITSLARTDALT
jgi:hypothetical protein